MSDSASSLISDWFRNHDDGEFVAARHDQVCRIIAPPATAQSVLYTTKRSLIETSAGSNLAGQRGEICCVGLPSDTELDRIRLNIGERALLFLGDLDPPDLMVYAWLREQLSPRSIEYRGVSDRFLAALGGDFPESSFLPLTGSERDALSLLPRVFSDLDEVIGPRCAEALQSGRKIELEALISWRQREAVLAAAMAGT